MQRKVNQLAKSDYIERIETERHLSVDSKTIELLNLFESREGKEPNPLVVVRRPKHEPKKVKSHIRKNLLS